MTDSYISPARSTLLDVPMASGCHEEDSDLDDLLFAEVGAVSNPFEGSENKDSDVDLFAEEGEFPGEDLDLVDNDTDDPDEDDSESEEDQPDRPLDELRAPQREGREVMYKRDWYQISQGCRLQMWRSLSLCTRALVRSSCCHPCHLSCLLLRSRWPIVCQW